MMTKKHFDAIAHTIRRAYEMTDVLGSQADKDVAYQTINGLVNSLAEEFEKFNPSFNRTRFKDACEVHTRQG